jgi:hypothetical protein
MKGSWSSTFTESPSTPFKAPDLSHQLSILEKLEYVFSPAHKFDIAPVSLVTNYEVRKFLSSQGSGDRGRSEAKSDAEHTSRSRSGGAKRIVPIEEFYKRCLSPSKKLTNGMSDRQIIDSGNKGLDLEQEKRRYKLMKAVYDRRGQQNKKARKAMEKGR